MFDCLTKATVFGLFEYICWVY